MSESIYSYLITDPEQYEKQNGYPMDFGPKNPQAIEGTSLISIDVGLLDNSKIYPEGMGPYDDGSYEYFQAWCKKFGVFYYARSREDFFRWEAIEFAQEAGCRYLVMEDLS